MDKQRYQAIFSKVALHLIIQNKKAHKFYPSGKIGGCAYRTEDGLKCAIGCIIPDKEYKPSFEMNSINTIISNIPSLKDFSEDHIATQWLYALQRIHDGYEPAQWYYELCKFAMEWKLELPEGLNRIMMERNKAQLG